MNRRSELRRAKRRARQYRKRWPNGFCTMDDLKRVTERLKGEFREALTRWHQATKLVPQCDHRAQLPDGAAFGLDAPEASRIERETLRELERQA